VVAPEDRDTDASLWIDGVVGVIRIAAYKMKRHRRSLGRKRATRARTKIGHAGKKGIGRGRASRRENAIVAEN